MVSCLLISCKKDSSSTTPTPDPTTTIATELQNLINGKTISDVHVQSTVIDYDIQNPTITFDQDFMIVNSTNSITYIAFEKIIMVDLSPSTSVPSAYTLEINTSAK